MLMRPNKAKTAVRGGHCPQGMVVHMRTGLMLACVFVSLRLFFFFVCAAFPDGWWYGGRGYGEGFDGVILQNIYI